jgi:hypothetical protein
MKRTKTKTAKVTQSELARQLGITRQLVAHHVKSGKAPELDDIDAWMEYLAANGREGSMPPELRKKVATARLRLINAQTDRVQMENREKRREMIEFAFVDKFLKHLTGGIFFSELSRMLSEFPTSLKGKTEVEIEAECAKQEEMIQNAVRAGLEVWRRKEKGQG